MRNNHQFLIWLTIICLCPVHAADQPNVLFIAMDDMNDVPTCMGRYSAAKTPNIDSLAGSGLLFTNAHTQFVTCGPSRASFLSSMYPSKINFNNYYGRNNGEGKNSADEVRELANALGGIILPDLFQQHGYKVLSAGKIFHTAHVPKGLDDHCKISPRNLFGSYKDGKRRYLKTGTQTDWGVTEQKEEDMNDAICAHWVIDRLKEKHDKPFLIMYGTLRPHVPWLVPQRFMDLYPDPDKIPLMPYKADDLDDIPKASKSLNIHPAMPRTEWLIESGEWPHMMQAYLASASFADHYVGKVLDALAASPYADSTIVVLLSDHGYHLGEKNTTQKHSLWERSSHVPLIFSGPGIEKGRTCKRVVGLIDVLPTLAELCGLPANREWQGRSLLPLLKDESREWPFPACTKYKGVNSAVQTEQYRYMLYADGSEELYDHKVDINEWDNIAGNSEYRKIKTELAAHIPATDKIVQERKPKKKRVRRRDSSR